MCCPWSVVFNMIFKYCTPRTRAPKSAPSDTTHPLHTLTSIPGPHSAAIRIRDGLSFSCIRLSGESERGGESARFCVFESPHSFAISVSTWCSLGAFSAAEIWL